jgi:hypothetical protein
MMASGITEIRCFDDLYQKIRCLDGEGRTRGFLPQSKRLHDFNEKMNGQIFFTGDSCASFEPDDVGALYRMVFKGLQTGKEAVYVGIVSKALKYHQGTKYSKVPFNPGQKAYVRFVEHLLEVDDCRLSWVRRLYGVFGTEPFSITCDLVNGHFKTDFAVRAAEFYESRQLQFGPLILEDVRGGSTFRKVDTDFQDTYFVKACDGKEFYLGRSHVLHLDPSSRHYLAENEIGNVYDLGVQSRSPVLVLI